MTSDRVIYTATVGYRDGTCHYLAVQPGVGFVALGAAMDPEAALDALGESALRERGLDIDTVEHVGDFTPAGFVEALKGGVR